MHAFRQKPLGGRAENRQIASDRYALELDGATCFDVLQAHLLARCDVLESHAVADVEIEEMNRAVCFQLFARDIAGINGADKDAGGRHVLDSELLDRAATGRPALQGSSGIA